MSATEAGEQLALIDGYAVVGTRLKVEGLRPFIPTVEGKPVMPKLGDEFELKLRVKVRGTGAAMKLDKETGIFTSPTEGEQLAGVIGSPHVEVLSYEPAEPFNPFGERDEREVG